MSLWIIIPVKPLNRAKSRLADVLSADQRAAFAETMLRRVLSVAQEAARVAGTLVISRDTKALSIARDAGAKTIQESSASDLNPALVRATEVVRAWGGSSVLILPADLPFVSVEDIEKMMELGVEDLSPTMVISTDKEFDGTNAMYVRPPGVVPYSYGIGSYDRHVAVAKQKNMLVKLYQSDNLYLDIDVPADLARYNQRVQNGKHDVLQPFLPDAAS